MYILACSYYWPRGCGVCLERPNGMDGHTQIHTPLSGASGCTMVIFYCYNHIGLMPL